MKIIYLHQYFNTPEMSGGTRSYEMARRLVEAGHEVHMVTSWRDKDIARSDWFETVEVGIRVHWLPVYYNNKMSYWSRIKAFFHFAIEAAKKASQLEGDIVFASSTPLTIAIPAALAARNNKIPMVFEVRDLWPEVPIALGVLKNPVFQWLAKKLEVWAYKNSSAVVALSPGMKAGVLNAGYPANQIAVIPNSSDNAEFRFNEDAARDFRSKRDWLGNRPLFIYAGTFGAVNGVGYLVDLARHVYEINPDIRFLLVGEGGEKDKVYLLAENAQVLNKNLFFEDIVPKKEMPGLFSAANLTSSTVIDVPELRHNSANKFFDSLAAGKPILINHGGWMHDLIISHQCGLAMWQKPMEEVAREVASKITDDIWLKEAGESARGLAETKFDRDKLAAQLEMVLNFVVNNKNQQVEGVATGVYK